LQEIHSLLDVLNINHKLPLVWVVSINNILLIHVDILSAGVLNEPLCHILAANNNKHTRTSANAV